jgi:DNA-directed RNA polymerase subunit RPC12/RpoP
MAEEMKDSTMESVAKGRTVGAFRCLNCFARISPPPAAKTYKCPHCGFEWRVVWMSPEVPRIRGPVWEVNRRLAEEAVTKRERGKK